MAWCRKRFRMSGLVSSHASVTIESPIYEFWPPRKYKSADGDNLGGHRRIVPASRSRMSTRFSADLRRNASPYRKVRAIAIGLAVWGPFFASVTAPRRALADPLIGVKLRLDAPSECPTLGALQRELRRDLQGSDVPGEALEVTVHIQQPGPEHWNALVEAKSDKGISQRTLVARNCAALIDASSLIIAMSIDPETAASNAKNPEVPTPHVEQPTSPADAAAPTNALPVSADPPGNKSDAKVPKESRAAVIAPQPTKTNGPTTFTRLRIDGIVGPQAALDYGSLPSIAPALGGVLGVRIGTVRTEIAISWWVPESKALSMSGGTSASARYGKVAGELRFCRQFAAAALVGVSPCVGMEVARWSGDASTLSVPTPSRSINASPLAGLLGTYDLADSLGLRVGVDVLLPLVTPRFGFYEAGKPVEAYRPARYQIRAALGFEWRFR